MYLKTEKKHIDIYLYRFSSKQTMPQVTVKLWHLVYSTLYRLFSKYLHYAIERKREEKIERERTETRPEGVWPSLN